MEKIIKIKESIQQTNPEFSDELLDLLYEYFSEKELIEFKNYNDFLKHNPEEQLKICECINKHVKR